MAKVSAFGKFQASVTKAIINYEKGSSVLVRLFETAIDAYHADGRKDETEYFLDALKSHKVLQKAAVSIAKRFVSGDISLKDGNVSITLKKWKEGKKEIAIAKFAEFKAKELNSFLNDKKVENAVMFALDARLKGMENSITKFLVDAIANGEDPAAVTAALTAVIQKVAKSDLTEKVNDAKEKLEKAKSDEPANESESVVETETVAELPAVVGQI